MYPSSHNHTQFPYALPTETSYYLPSNVSPSYNINDYLPHREERISRRLHLIPFQLNFKRSKDKESKLKQKEEKIRTLEDRIREMEMQKIKREQENQKEFQKKKTLKILTTSENIQTDICSFYHTRRLGWGQKMQITIVPLKCKRSSYLELNYDKIVQTEFSEQKIVKKPLIQPSVSIPHIQPQPQIIAASIPSLYLPPLNLSLPRSSDTTRQQYGIENIISILNTQRNKQNINLNNRRRSWDKKIKDDSVDLYPVRVNEVIQIVRVMLAEK